MSLFLKIFLWFWLAMALIVGAITLVSWSTSSEPLARQRTTFLNEIITSGSQTAVQIFESDGVEGLGEYFERRSNSRRVNSIGFFSKDGELVAGNLKVADINELFDEALQTDQPKFRRVNVDIDGVPKRIVYGAKRVIVEDGTTYVYIIEIVPFRQPTFFTGRLLLQILTVFLIGGLFCYFLARYLTSPITRLRAATQRVAKGDFETKVSDGNGNRKDELAALASDFDEMASRIETLITSEKRLTQDISHELRSPLARMNVALELARAKSNPETLPLLERLERESESLNDLIGQLLTLSKLETGTQRFEKTPVDMSKVIEQIVADADFEAKVDRKSVKILQNDPVSVNGDEGLLKRAVENVVRNAVRYTIEGTSVEVSLEKSEQDAILKIRDYGDGVPAEELEKLFKPFYRIQEARDRKSGGVGLGLAIAEQAIRKHDGSIAARNTEKGLLVEMKLPSSGA
ncbi:MAG: HAMP domain-containing protein [Pyrinomonadaceae bacterium]|nr:HAMP domain-containing protein [Pyrinomonadaceae bacterium]